MPPSNSIKTLIANVVYYVSMSLLVMGFLAVSFLAVSIVIHLLFNAIEALFLVLGVLVGVAVFVFLFTWAEEARNQR